MEAEDSGLGFTQNQTVPVLQLSISNPAVVQPSFAPPAAGVSNCYVFKSRLQEYTQKLGISMPVYETTKEGPLHEPTFRSSVTVNNVRYDSLPGFYNRKAAEQSAAEVAFLAIMQSGDMSNFVPHPVHETGLCKNLLQEYAQKMSHTIPFYTTVKPSFAPPAAGVSNCYVFKSRLQEYTQKLGISTPVYETTKEGPSHEPTFRSSVTVNNVRYDSLPGFYNRKTAEQSAAEVAFLAIMQSGDMSNFVPHPVHETGLCKNLLQEYAQKMSYTIPFYTTVKPSFAPPAAGVSNCYVFKSRLQEYTQKLGISMPVYETTKEGPLHEPTFRSSVTVNNVRYDSLPGFYNRKAAEQSAAEVALLAIMQSGDMSNFVPHPVHETGLCKNLLQEYAQKMSYAIPFYTTVKHGLPGQLSFTCTVEIGGMQYIGAAAKTEKEAEINAARTALLAIQSCTRGNDTSQDAGSVYSVLPGKKKGRELEKQNGGVKPLKPKKAVYTVLPGKKKGRELEERNGGVKPLKNQSRPGSKKD